ncbi:unnamed protein product [Paramecium pentaurelia]|uniref:Tetratricopeptide repeat protein n=1 Tax=Paramecium pentaurelia TaxID=43138 RepID=A0A8S1WL38_9CILI|nr:unnamed protein product [Paramecium pentaurelia]
MNQSIFAYGYLNNGLVYQKQGKFEKAIIEYNKAIEESPSYAAAFQNRANAFSSLMNFEEAFKDYSIAIRINPQYSAAYFNRGLLHGKQGKFEEAIMDYTEYIKMVPDNAQAYNNRANAYQNLGNFYEAIRDYSKSIEINPQYAAAYNNRAIEDCSKAVELQMVNADAFYIRGNAYKNKGKLQEAIIDYSKAVEINSQHSAAHYNRGLIYSDQKIFDQAIQDYSKAIGISPANPLYQFSLGFLQFSLKQFNQAYQYFESALECSLKLTLQQRLQFQLSKDKMMFLHQKVEILSSINQELQIFKEALKDLQRNNKISQIQDQQYQFVINNIENQFLQIVPSQLNENQVETLKKLKFYKEKIKGLQKNIYKQKENQNQDLEPLTQNIKQINSLQLTQMSRQNQDLYELKKQLSSDQNLYYRSLYWHLFNYFYAINLISKDLQQINIQSHSVLGLEILQKIEKLKNQVEESESIIIQIFELLNSALDQVINTNKNQFQSRISCIKQILQVFIKFPSEYESEIDSASLFLANNINFYFEKDNVNIFNIQIERISILEFDFEKYSENQFWKTGILHTLIILNYLIENFKQILIQSSFCSFKDVMVRSIIEFNSELFSKNQKEQQEGFLS